MDVAQHTVALPAAHGPDLPVRYSACGCLGGCAYPEGVSGIVFGVCYAHGQKQASDLLCQLGAREE